MSLSVSFSLDLVDDLKQASYHECLPYRINNVISLTEFMKLNLLQVKIILLRCLRLKKGDECTGSGTARVLGNSSLVELKKISILLKEINALLPIDGDDMKNMIDLSGEINSLREENEKLKKALSHFTQ
jgi:hypothetical protein